MFVCVSHSVVSFCDPMDCSPSGSSVHGILQARILESLAISFSMGSSQPRNDEDIIKKHRIHIEGVPNGQISDNFSNKINNNSNNNNSWNKEYIHDSIYI